MSGNRGAERISQLQKKWQRTALLVQILRALAAALLLSLAFQLWYGLIAFAIILPLLLFLNQSWRVPVKSLVQHLNKTYPALEESAQLLLPAPQTLLQQLQQHKVSERLNELDIRSPFRKQLLLSVGLLLLALIIFTGARQWKTKENSITTPAAKHTETKLAAIQSATLTITPPAYTQLSSRSQSQFSIRAEAGAEVKWQLALNATASQVSLIFNDGSSLQLKPAGGSWQVSKTILKPGFYQVKIDDRLSELYPIETIKDAPPVITVQSPQPSVSIPYNSSQQFSWQSKVMDDYGLLKLQLSIIVASGQGEAVKFREQQLALPVQQHAKAQNVQRTLNCRALNMQPGDEVYVWLSATDNHAQETRSDVYVISLQDTSGQITIDGLLTGLDVKPEFFRSQRQIIIETEQLLRNRAKISVKEFQDKSNDLGTDQKLLRLRYGKFLGEEFSAEIGTEHHEEGAHKEEKDEAAAMMELYSHNHDNAEDATYFDPATKRQLKAMLTEMWNAELQLRTFFPKDALPYEYKALRLLKDLQQKSRSYVAKTTFTPPPLQMNKRLSGDVSKANAGLRQQNISADEQELLLRKAIGVLEELKTSGQLSADNMAVLQPAYQELSTKAALQPALYLESLAAYRKVLGDAFRIGDIRAAQRGLQQLLPPAPALPYAPAQGGSTLSQAYFENLRKSHR